jgi:hypothetical protein
MITCPYCFNTFEPKDVHFRSVDKNQPPIIDRNLSEYNQSRNYSANATLLPAYTERNMDIGRLIYNYGIPIGYRETSFIETYIRLCPFCHNNLPTDSGVHEQRMIALTGNTQTGKTVFLLSLMDGIRQLGYRGLAQWQEDPFVQDDYYRPKLNELKTTLVLPPPTPYIALPPKTYTLTVRNKSDFKKYCISFFDMPGESLNDPEHLREFGRFIQKADGIVFMIDPVGFPGINTDAIGRERRKREYDPASDLAVITRIAKIENRRIPIALTITKSDAIFYALREHPEIMHPGSAVFNHSDHSSGFDERDHRNVHMLCRKFLEDRLEQCISYIDMNPNIDLFMISSLGCMPCIENDTQKIEAFEPRRIADPILWILSRKNSIGVRAYPIYSEDGGEKKSDWLYRILKNLRKSQ